jgi:hypothetical protein
MGSNVNAEPRNDRRHHVSVDPWEKAADCERALRITVDRIRREIVSNIREFWIALANERPFLSEEDLAAQIDVISDFHATLDRNIHA